MYYWGNPDTSVTFCESKYTKVFWIAEFYNTLSSLCYICVGLYYIKSKHYPIATMVTCVGIGSVLLHGTLRYYGQWVDEVSMLVSSIMMLDYLNSKLITKKSIPFFIIFYFFFYKTFLVFLCTFTLLNIYMSYLVFKSSSINYCMYNILVILGTSCWFIDRFLCDSIEFLYLHAWWHILTSAAISTVFLGLTNSEESI
jgi:hypothetical protein